MGFLQKIKIKLNYITDLKLRYFRNCLKRDLKQAKESNLFLKVNILTDACCEECAKNESKNLDLDKVLIKKPLPYKNCVRKGGCICVYTFESVRDANGRLIRKK